jgi:hypothetical protein
VKRLLFFIAGVLFSLLLTLALAVGVHFIGGGQWPALNKIKDYVDIASKVTQIVALGVAGWWTYRLFVKQRIEYPYPDTECMVEHWPIEAGKLYLSVTVVVRNVGHVLLELESAQIFIRQIRPMPEDQKALINKADRDDLREGRIEGLFQEQGTQISWYEIGYREQKWERGEIKIEPGETEELQYDFILDDTVKTVKIIGYFKNVQARGKDPETGWHVTSVYDVDNGASGKKRSGCLMMAWHALKALSPKQLNPNAGF